MIYDFPFPDFVAAVYVLVTFLPASVFLLSQKNFTTLSASSDNGDFSASDDDELLLGILRITVGRAVVTKLQEIERILRAYLHRGELNK